MYSLLLDTTDSTFNLALEDHLFSTMPADHPGWFLLWRNRPSIIVGRHQNTLEEINQQLVQKYQLDVVRRITGGGAVFHDEGNLNYSFLHHSEAEGIIDFKRYLTPIAKALAELGVKAQLSSRNDLTIDGKKISGAAQTRRGRRVLHHGTMLVDLNMDMLEAVLTGAPDKYLSKGISSVRSRVTNLSEVWPQNTTMKALQDVFIRNCASAPGELCGEDIAAAEQLADKKYRTWEWNYGKSPRYTEKLRHRFPWGAVDARLDIQQGIIRHCNISGDFFAELPIEELTACLQGVAHTPSAIIAALTRLDLPRYFTGSNSTELLNFFTHP